MFHFVLVRKKRKYHFMTFFLLIQSLFFVLNVEIHLLLKLFFHIQSEDFMFKIDTMLTIFYNFEVENINKATSKFELTCETDLLDCCVNFP